MNSDVEQQFNKKEMNKEKVGKYNSAKILNAGKEG